MIPAGIVSQIEDLLESQTGAKTTISASRAIGGGSINQAVELNYGGKKFFLKWNHASRFPQMFSSEAMGLNYLRSTNSMRIPKVIGTGADNHHSFLLLEYIAESVPSRQFWVRFGHQLATLHRNTGATFGLDHDNYIGSLQQSNKPMQSWTDFYMQQRLMPQLQKALYKGAFEHAFMRRFERFFLLLPQIFPDEQPSLLHGDLWNGNFLCDVDGNAVLIDPAVYFGHREMDMAMTRLFGGFHPDFYAAYQEVFPLESNWQKRIEICQLYPLLVHVNLFGGGYIQQVMQIINRYV